MLISLHGINQVFSPGTRCTIIICSCKMKPISMLYACMHLTFPNPFITCTFYHIHRSLL